MSPIAVGGFAPVQSDLPETRELRTRDDEAFAGMLNGAMQTHAPAPQPTKPKDGTSELDRPDAQENDETDAAKGTEDDPTRPTKRARTNRARPTGDVVRSLDLVDPTLQDKLARVIARMREETGLDVSVSETYRSQTRQNALYAQGRATPGDVVTWTRHSQHTAGRAVDVVVNGAPGAGIADAYATLQRIANEEGLHTLGAKDPGHLELGTGGIDISSLKAVQQPSPSQGQTPLAHIADVARVAEVSLAQPAQVARVAAVARPNEPATAPRSITGGAHNANATAPAGDAGAATIAAGSTGEQRFNTGRDSRGQSGNGDSRGYGAMAAAVAMREQNAASFALPGVTAMTAPSSAERATRLIEAMQDAPARPLSQITMNVDAGNGTMDRVQLSLRGASLNGTIDTADARAAQAMTSRTDELARALTKDGIDLQSFHVRSSTAGTTSNVTGAAQSQNTGNGDTSSSSRFDRGSWGAQERQRSQQDREERQQQREQRGGKR